MPPLDCRHTACDISDCSCIGHCSDCFQEAHRATYPDAVCFQHCRHDHSCKVMHIEVIASGLHGVVLEVGTCAQTAQA